MRIAVIPARGGSKRIPRKNVRPFLGRPIIAYSIEAALQSGLFDLVMVSTDDEEISADATKAGAQTPFSRPLSLADDVTGTNAVVRHAIDWLRAEGHPTQEICCLYATAPFITASDLRAAHARLTSGVDFVFTTARFNFPIQRALTADATGLVRPLFPESIGKRSQDLPVAIHDAGQFYWGHSQSFQAHDLVFAARAVAYELSGDRVQDIDTEEDWTRAEALYRIWMATR